MKIKKIGHCCLVIEEGGLRILTDPGTWTADEQVQEKDLDLILITHEHPDHLHTESLKQIMKNNPQAKILTNSGVGKVLQAESVQFEILEDGQETEVSGLKLSGHGQEHAEIYQEFGQVENTGFFIGSRLYYPGDSFFDPGKPVEVLALPIEAPWMAIKEAFDFALKLKPKFAFPVHDGMLNGLAVNNTLAKKILSEQGIDYRPLGAGEIAEF